jgi:hypothetical protein
VETAVRIGGWLVYERGRRLRLWRWQWWFGVHPPWEER